jgi:hypothetical protein
VFILENKYADREDLNNMHLVFQNIITKSDVEPKTPALKGLQIAESNRAMFAGHFSSTL